MRNPEWYSNDILHDMENVKNTFIKHFQNHIYTQAVGLKYPCQFWELLICILDDFAIPLSPTSTCLSGFSSFSGSLCSRWTFSVIKSPFMSKRELRYKCTLLVVSLPTYTKGTQLGIRPFGRKRVFTGVHENSLLAETILDIEWRVSVDIKFL